MERGGPPPRGTLIGPSPGTAASLVISIPFGPMAPDNVTLLRATADAHDRVDAGGRDASRVA
ncbi:hypothetical protein GCM10010298_36310 [Streptomyces microflavus]|uniref:Uncharacterized protein n=1 Tax=Streptomyces microflavus TaxID=1919 RepID=A0A7J0D5Z0_STRMI|nr:hypothetical protein Smic_79610 [Streptomyces microflavus]GGX68102.1 hypothetical protein GCM10010298_36310 [Streptomyces microflavus]